MSAECRLGFKRTSIIIYDDRNGSFVPYLLELDEVPAHVHLPLQHTLHL